MVHEIPKSPIKKKFLKMIEERTLERKRDRETVLKFSARKTVFIQKGILHYRLVFALTPEGLSKLTLLTLEESIINLR